MISPKYISVPPKVQHNFMSLPNDTALIADLTGWRHVLHSQPELSGQEIATAGTVTDRLRAHMPDEIMTGLGGHGVAAIFRGQLPGPTILLRCELDGLPIEELSDLPYRSKISGKGHLCGHDGHMAIIAGMAARLAATPPASGRVVLLFQPAEEDGSGAARVIADHRFAQITPDYAFALHNFPGLSLGHARLADGTMNCASRGMRLQLTGRTAHASMPETGISPLPALAALMPELTALSQATDDIASPRFRLVTVTHAHMGEPAFGVAPGEAQLWATLRSRDDSSMEMLVTQAEAMARKTARAAGLMVQIDYDDIFSACQNNPEATALIRAALDTEGVIHDADDLPMRASEDFGRFGAISKSAMFLLGAGKNRPALHNPDYDFPDGLIPVGIRIFDRIVRQMLG